MDAFLVVAPQGLGDALEATPIVAALRRARPNARIDVAVLRAGPRELFSQLSPSVDDVFHYPYWERGLASFAVSVARALGRGRRYDVSLLAYPAARPEYQLLTGLHGARLRVSHDYGAASRSRSGRELRVPIRQAHNVERNLDLVQAIGIDVEGVAAYLVPDGWKAPLKDPRRIAIHAGSVTHHGLSNKRWAVDRFAELGARMAGRGHAICVVSGPDEAAESRRIAASIPGARVIEGPLPDIARSLSECAAAVTNDSGIGHLAAAVGTTVLSLHGPTPVEGGPYGPHAIRFRPSPCPACFDPKRRNTSCALGIDFACLKGDLPVDAVERRLLEALSSGAAVGA